MRAIRDREENGMVKILKSLNKEWQSSGKIATLSGVNYYQAEKVLNHLKVLGRVESFKNNRGNYWRKGKK